MEYVDTAILVVAMLSSAVFGFWLRRRIADRHLSAQSIDSIRLLMGMLLTFAALVLGLLTSNAKQRFDHVNDDLSSFAADLIELDRTLVVYGPDAAGARALLRQYTAAALADTWPDEPRPFGSYPRVVHRESEAGIEGQSLGALLGRVSVAIYRFDPSDGFHQRVAAALRDRINAVVAERWTLIFEAQSTIAWPFLLTLLTWMCIIFAIFGMTSPPGRVVYVAMVLSALSIASPLYLIIEYSDTLSGAIALPSAPLRAALAHMDAPIAVQ